MSTTLIIPHIRSVEHDSLLVQCINSMRKQVDEIIVVENEGMGYGPAVNKGIEQWRELNHGKYDQVIISNNDITLVAGKLWDLQKYICGQHLSFAVPMIIPIPRDNNPRPFFATNRFSVERLIKEDGFFYDPQFVPGYFEDDDLIKRLELKKAEIIYEPSVIVSHVNGGGSTIKTFGEQESFNINNERFEKKWAHEQARRV